MGPLGAALCHDPSLCRTVSHSKRSFLFDCPVSTGGLVSHLMRLILIMRVHNAFKTLKVVLMP